MKIISVKSKTQPYDVVISKSALTKKHLQSVMAKRSKVLLITDSKIPKKHIIKVKKIIGQYSVSLHTYLMNAGESSKSQKVFFDIQDYLLKNRFERSDLIIAFGGGVVGDMSGFVASTYLRGIDYLQVPTTLLSQVDSSVGGKTAINTRHGKNLIGSFYNPLKVIIDLSFLETLPEREYKAGLAEIIKYGLIKNKKLLDYLFANEIKINDKALDALEYIIYESVKTKAKIVSMDEKESGVRAILNFGHTFGHAIEAHHNYKSFLHGEAVAIGMLMAAKLSQFENHISEKQFNFIEKLLNQYNLNYKLKKMTYKDFTKHIKQDKKVKSGKVRIVLLKRLSNAFVTEKFGQLNFSRAIKQHLQ